MEEKTTDRKNQEINTGKSFAYKAIFVEDGIILLFDRVKLFKQEDIRINIYGGELFLELGNNVALVTEDMLRHLIKTKNLFVYESVYETYEASNLKSAFELEPDVLARIQGAWEVMRKVVDRTEQEEESDQAKIFANEENGDNTE